MGTRAAAACINFQVIKKKNKERKKERKRKKEECGEEKTGSCIIIAIFLLRSNTTCDDAMQPLTCHLAPPTIKIPGVAPEYLVLYTICL